MNIQTTGFDYSTLDAETRIVVQQRVTEIKALAKRSAQDTIDIGKKLAEVKAKLGYGQFQNWYSLEFGFSRETANTFMRIAEKFGADSSTWLTTATSVLDLLSKPSTPESAFDEAVKVIMGGKPLEPKQAKAIVQKHKPLPPLTYSKPIDDYQPEVPEVEIDSKLPIVSSPPPSPFKRRYTAPTPALMGNLHPVTVTPDEKSNVMAGAFATNGNGAHPVDSTKLQAEVDRLRAENERLTRQLEAMRKLNTPPLLIHMVNDAKVSQDAVSLVMKKHGEVKTRLLLQTCIEFKVTPHDILAFSESWSQLVSKSCVDPAEEQRKAEAAEAKKAEQERKAAEKEAKRQPIPAVVMNPMKDAIYQGFGWERDKITKHMWGEIQEAAKQLCEVKCCPEHVKHGVRFLKNNFDGAGPLALAKHYPTWSKSIPKPIPETEPELELVGPPTEEARLAWENVDNLFGRM